MVHDRIVTTEELTTWIGLSAQEIGVLEARGIISQSECGWSLHATVVALVRYYGEIAAERGNDDVTVH